MKILDIPDIHGNWEDTLKFIEENKDNVDLVVSHGDYVDDFDESKNGKNMIDGFSSLVSMARAEPDKFRILIGNHDLSYVSDPNVSGHHSEYSADYRHMFMSNLDIMNVAVAIDGWVFSHAGISSRWYNEMIAQAKLIDGNYFNFIPKEEWEAIKTPVEQINKLFHLRLFEWFDYNENSLDTGDGNSSNQGPLWIRPPALLNHMLLTKQVVGHTEIYPPAPIMVKKGENTLILTDTEAHNGWFVFDTNDPEHSVSEIQIM